MQLDLLGSPMARAAAWDESDDNLFFASIPASEALRSEVADRAESLRESHGLGPLRKAGVQHITFSHFGHYGHIPDAVAAAREIGHAVTIERCEIVLDHYCSFYNRDGKAPFALTASQTPDAVKLANRELTKRIRRLGLECPTGINAHVTLLYGPETVPQKALERPLIWPVEELVLIMSRKGAQEHVVIDRWPAIDG